MLVRKSDPDTAAVLPKKDRQKLAAIIMLDGLEEPRLIRKALKVIKELSDQQKS